MDAVLGVLLAAAQAASDPEGGLWCVAGPRDEGYAKDLVRRPGRIVHWLLPAAGDVGPARTWAEREGLLGRLTFDVLQPPELPYADHLLTRLVVRAAPGVPEAELLRVLRPGGLLVRDVGAGPRPRPPEFDDWPQWRHGPDRNPVSTDLRVEVPRRIQWLSLQGKEGKDMVVAGGRAYYAHGGLLQARDAFNGVPLWASPMEPRCSPVATPGGVVVRRKAGVALLDGASGRELLPLPEAGRPTGLLLSGDLLVASAEDGIRVLSLGSGALTWRRNAEKPRAISSASGRLYWVEGDPSGEGECRVVAADLATGREAWSRTDHPWARHVYRSSTSGGILSFEQGRFAAPKAVMGIPKAEPAAVHFLSAADGSSLRDYAYAPAMRHDENVRVFFIDGRPVVHRVERDKNTSHLATFRDLAAEPSLVPALPPGKENFYCYPPTATTRFFIYGQLGFTEWTTGRHESNPLTRGTCGAWSEGVIPANGMVYIFPKSCNCFSMLSGVGALAPADRRPIVPSHPLEKGPAYGEAAGPAAGPADWPSYRGDEFRSGSNPRAVPGSLRELWSSAVGASWPEGPLAEEWREYPYSAGLLTPPVIACGLVLVAEPHRHRIVALDAASGALRWTHVADGRIDTAPTVHEGRVLFGTRTGRVVCLRLSDGVLMWRLRAAPADRHIVQFGQVESPWPVAGSVLVSRGTAYLSAGLHPLADGGIRVLALDPATGAQRWTKTLTDMGYGEKGWHARAGLEQDALDLMVRDGDRVALSRWSFDPADGTFDFRWHDAFYRLGTDGAYLQRGSWSYGYPMNRPRMRRPLLVGRDRAALGANRVREQGALRLFRRDFEPGERFDVIWDEQSNDTASRIGQYFPVNRIAEKVTWSAPYPGWIEAMVLAGDRLVLYAAGKRWVVSGKDGTTLSESEAPKPVWDGYAAAGGRLYVSTADGRVVCLGD